MEHGVMETVRLARNAMATRFEVLIQGTDAVRLRAAGEEALDEIDHIDEHLSFFNPQSLISHINAMAATRPVKVDAGTFRLLVLARDLSARTRGAFDPTVAPLMKCWGLTSGAGNLPDSETIAETRELTGMHRVHLDAERRTVSFERAGMMLDLGSIGKGHAIDEAVRILRAGGVSRALIHGGTSTAYAVGRPIGDEAWFVAIAGRRGADNSDHVEIVSLRDEALSVSAVWGKSFEFGGHRYGHVLDPRLGRPVQGAVLAAVVHPSATVSDALSTALLVAGREILDEEAASGRSLVVLEGADGTREVLTLGRTTHISDEARQRDSFYRMGQTTQPYEA